MVREAEQAFMQGVNLRAEGDGRAVTALRAVAELRRGCGAHREAISMLDKALDSSTDQHLVELFFMRGVPNGHMNAPDAQEHLL